MAEAKKTFEKYRGHSLSDDKRIKFPQKRPGLLKQLIDECHDHYGGNLHGWMLAKLAEPVPSKHKK